MTRRDLEQRIAVIERGGLGVRSALWQFHTGNVLPEDDPELAADVVACAAWAVLGRVLLDEGDPDEVGDLMRQVDRGQCARYLGVDTTLRYADRDFSDAQRERWDALWELESELRPPREQLGDLRYR